MTFGGWINLILSVGFVTGLLAWCDAGLTNILYLDLDDHTFVPHEFQQFANASMPRSLVVGHGFRPSRQ